MLGGMRDPLMKRNEVLKEKADDFARSIAPIIKSMRTSGESLAAIAEALNNSGKTSPRGGQWTATTVKRVIDRT
ncbi:Recombinase [compost metagenome]